jgi:hypothetical protein
MVWVYYKPTRRNIPEDGILHSHSRENLKSYTGVFLIHLYISWLNESVAINIKDMCTNDA